MKICNVRADRIFTMHIGSFGAAKWVWSIEMEELDRCWFTAIKKKGKNK